jgi:hypothetical protein
MTELFVLRPVNVKDPVWVRNRSRGSCYIWGETEASARDLAAQEFKIDGEPFENNPWLDPDKTDCGPGEALTSKPD